MTYIKNSFQSLLLFFNILKHPSTYIFNFVADGQCLHRKLVSFTKGCYINLLEGDGFNPVSFRKSPFLRERKIFWKGIRVLHEQFTHTAQKILPLKQVSTLQRDGLEAPAFFTLIFASFSRLAESALCFSLALLKKEFSCSICQFRDYFCLKGSRNSTTIRTVKGLSHGRLHDKPGVGI